MSDQTGEPKYLQVAEVLRRRIREGAYPIDSELPSTTELTRTFGVSTTVVRAAIKELKAEGIAQGQPGKAVYVRARPEAAGRPSDDLRQRVADLETLVHSFDDRLAALEARLPRS